MRTRKHTYQEQFRWKKKTRGNMLEEHIRQQGELIMKVYGRGSSLWNYEEYRKHLNQIDEDSSI